MFVNFADKILMQLNQNTNNKIFTLFCLIYSYTKSRGIAISHLKVKILNLQEIHL